MSLALIVSPKIILEEQAVERPTPPLFDEESAMIRNAIGKRRREFACGRHCAHRSLQRMGVPVAAIVSGPDRAPVWPSGVVGSITHCHDYCAAALARSTEIASVGIDAEIITQFDRPTLEMFASPEEQLHLKGLPTELASVWSCILFSAKESVFKCWYPLTKRWLDFHDAKLTIHPSTLSFEVKMSTSSSGFPQRARGRFYYTRTHVFTAMEIAAARDVR